ncbi:methyltransferase family protein [Melittangium boletus]|uniref:methyltransferase family protein n=1 Tax=Melittangium boletus TaxID=83453 RepID=UPI003DA2D2BC
MKELHDAPVLYLGFISLHVLLGHLGASLVYRLRFGRGPLAYRRTGADPTHTRLMRHITGASVVWAISVVAAALWPRWSELPWGRPLLTLPPEVGWALSVLGLVGMLAAQYGMGATFRIGVDAGDDSPVLHAGGLHRRSRNPIYVFSYLYLVGSSLWAPSLVTLGSCAVLGGLFHGMVLQEERYLSARLGEAYARYRQRVPRYL